MAFGDIKAAVDYVTKAFWGDPKEEASAGAARKNESEVHRPPANADSLLSSHNLSDSSLQLLRNLRATPIDAVKLKSKLTEDMRSLRKINGDLDRLDKAIGEAFDIYKEHAGYKTSAALRALKKPVLAVTRKINNYNEQLSTLEIWARQVNLQGEGRTLLEGLSKIFKKAATQTNTLNGSLANIKIILDMQEQKQKNRLANNEYVIYENPNSEKSESNPGTINVNLSMNTCREETEYAASYLRMCAEAVAKLSANQPTHVNSSKK